jgi:hypothetical protein
MTKSLWFCVCLSLSLPHRMSRIELRDYIGIGFTSNLFAHISTMYVIQIYSKLIKRRKTPPPERALSAFTRCGSLPGGIRTGRYRSIVAHVMGHRSEAVVRTIWTTLVIIWLIRNEVFCQQTTLSFDRRLGKAESLYFYFFQSEFSPLVCHTIEHWRRTKTVLAT